MCSLETAALQGVVSRTSVRATAAAADVWKAAIMLANCAISAASSLAPTRSAATLISASAFLRPARSSAIPCFIADTCSSRSWHPGTDRVYPVL